MCVIGTCDFDILRAYKPHTYFKHRIQSYTSYTYTKISYEFIEYGISYRKYLKIPIRSWRGKDCVHDVRKLYRAVHISIPIRCVRKDHFEFALYCRHGTARLCTAPHVEMTRCRSSIVRYSTVPFSFRTYRIVFDTRLIFYQVRTRRHRTVRYRGRIREHICCGGSRFEVARSRRYIHLLPWCRLRVSSQQLDILLVIVSWACMWQ